MNICICGGGNLGHVITGFLASKGDNEVNLLTRHPERWAGELLIHTPDEGDLHGRVHRISSNPAEVVRGADIVLLCLPGYSIADVLEEIRGDITPGTIVGSVVSSTGFFDAAHRLLPANTPLFGFQRVPFIARTEVYGHSATLMGRKPQLSIGMMGVEDPETLCLTMENLFLTPTKALHSHYEACLSNSNPLLHPSRLFTMWSEWRPGIVFPSVGMFYEEWTDEASEVYIAMDRELHQLLDVLPVRPGCLPTVLEYYESTDVASLTRKLRSIKAFHGIKMPMREAGDGSGYVPDLRSRYFTEDFPYGLDIIRATAQRHHISTPTMDRIHEWGEKMQRYATESY